MYMGIDLGSSALKVAVVDFDRNEIVSLKKRSIDMLSPRADFAEQDPDEWWKKLIGILNEMRKENLFDFNEIEGIGVVSQREGIVLVGKEGEALTNCITWIDRRSEKQAIEISNMLDPRYVYERTGLRISAGFTATKLLWFKENNPEPLEKASYFLQPKDYIVYKLTGIYATDYSLASRTLLFDIHKLDWIDEFFDKLDIPNKFPRVYWSTEVVGETSNEIAESTGLPKGIPVAAGGGDRQGENLACCGARKDTIAISLGTTININTALDKPYVDPQMRSTTSLHLLENKWLLELGLSSGTLILRWFVENFAKDLGEEAYRVLTEKASHVKEGAEGLYVFPFIIGVRAPWWQKETKAAIIGFYQGHKREHIFRALIEGLSYNVKAAFAVIEDSCERINNVYVIGGGSENKLWLRILSNILDMRLKVLGIENAGVLAAASLNVLRERRDVAARIFENPRVREEYYPDREFSIRYQKLYEDYIVKVEKYLRDF